MSVEPSGGPRLLVVAGEASGDLHGASFVRELRREFGDLSVWAVGGERLEGEGVELLYHYRHLAVVGVTEVLAHLGDVRRAMWKIVEAARRLEVDAVVLLDYPDFNMALARRLRKVRPELPITYYISPQVWAWRPGRVSQIAKLVDQMLVILPFEKELYEGHGVEVEFVGHPLLDVVPETVARETLGQRHALDPGRDWIGLLPGSRRSEVSRLLQPMVAAAGVLAATGDQEFLIPRAPGLERRLYEEAVARVALPAGTRVHVVESDYYGLLGSCRGALVCSGTATLEAALMGTPMVVVYKTSWLTYNLGKLLVRIRDIALVNVVAGRRGVPELLQTEVSPERMVAALRPLLGDGPKRSRCLEFLQEVRVRLGDPGASRRAAMAVARVIRGRRDAKAS